MTHYETLGVSKDASIDDIKKSYRKLVKELHPDRTAGDSELQKKFIAVQEAYDVLSDKNKKANYDAIISGDMQGVHVIFDSFFGGRQPRKGKDVYKTVEITLEEVYSGIDKKAINIEEREICKSCDGSGVKEWRACRKCSGSGKAYAGLPMNVFVICFDCSGTGREGKSPCLDCHGDGSNVLSNKDVFVEIQPGVEDGSRMIGPNLGFPCKDGLPGNLVVTVKVLPHKFFIRNGLDLLVKIPVSYAELVLGTKITIQCLSGIKVVAEIPPGTNCNTRLKIKNAGLIRGSKKGDVLIEPILNTSISEKMKEVAKFMLEFDTPDRKFLCENDS
jgi:molecular chaperone DnaJ